MTEQLLTLRDVLRLFAEMFRRLFSKRAWGWSDINHAAVQIAVESLPVIVVSTAFAGVVVTNEIAWHLDRALHSVTMAPGATGQFILRELGIAVPAMLLVSKVGASITAEVGTMKVTEQIDALRLLGIDPLSYLVFPRWIAAVFSGLCLTLIAASVTLGCAIAVAVLNFHFSTMEYLNALRHFISYTDLVCAVIKGMIFSSVIPIISCAYGFRCQGGAEGVGTATTHSVVTSTIAVIILDFVLTYLFTLIL